MAAPVLSKEASATLRDQLLAELEGLMPQEDLGAWTFHAQPETPLIVLFKLAGPALLLVDALVKDRFPTVPSFVVIIFHMLKFLSLS